MREILFRGKRKDNGEWVYGSLMQITCKDENNAIPFRMIFEDKFSFVGGDAKALSHAVVDPKSVGQSTTLKDKNGRRIFEGDIVHCIARLDEADCVVIFEDGEFRLVPTKRYATYVTGCGFHALRNFEKEVIGNIHDNPELMGDDNA